MYGIWEVGSDTYINLLVAAEAILVSLEKNNYQDVLDPNEE